MTELNIVSSFCSRKGIIDDLFASELATMQLKPLAITDRSDSLFREIQNQGSDPQT